MAFNTIRRRHFKPGRYDFFESINESFNSYGVDFNVLQTCELHRFSYVDTNKNPLAHI